MTTAQGSTQDERPGGTDDTLLAEFLDEAVARLSRGEQVSARDLLHGAPHLVGRGEQLLEEVRALFRVAIGVRHQELLVKSELLSRLTEGAGSAPAAEVRAEAEALPEPFPGEFRVVRRLGHGAFGSVWLAEDLHLGRLVALKTILVPGSPQPPGLRLERLREEARLLAAVRHRNIVQVHAWRETPAGPGGSAGHYLVLEYVPGGSLADRVQQEGPLPWQQAARYLADVAEGLLEVHARGIVHRDVKPANVLWHPERDEVLLTDFGVSARLADGGTGGGGTPFYMPPEAFEGRTGPAQDVYGLAASLFWLVTGTVPFPTEAVSQIPARIRAGLPDPDPRCADMPAALERLIRAGLTARPEDRPSLRAFAEGLRGALNQLLADSLLSGAPSAGGRVRLTVSRQVDRGHFVPVATTSPQPERLVRDVRRVPPAPDRVEVFTGERVRIEVETDEAGHVTVFNVGPTGNLNLLFPEAPGRGDVVGPGQPRQVIDVELTPPAGSERIFALWSRGPLSLHLEEVAEMVGGGETSGPARATRDMKRVQESVGRLVPEEWSVAVVNLRHLGSKREGS